MKTRNINLIMLLCGVLIFAALFIGVKNPYELKTEEVEAANEDLQPRLEVLEEHYANVEAYEANIEEASVYIDDQVTYYPANVQEEDFLVWVLDWEEDLEHDVTSVSLNPGYGLYTFPCYIGADDTLVDMTASIISVELESDISYSQFKESLDYIYDENMTTSLDSVSLAYNSETGLLGTSFVIDKYYLAYEGAEYTGETMPNVSQGVSDLFRAE